MTRENSSENDDYVEYASGDEIDAHLSEIEVKRAIARQIDSDPSRYTETAIRLTNEEISAIANQLGLGFLSDETNSDRRNAIMLKLGRDHRVNDHTWWDASDVRAVLAALQEVENAE